MKSGIRWILCILMMGYASLATGRADESDSESRPPLNPGGPVPDFELTLLNGKTFTLSGQRGNIIIVDFWATWCAPCLRVMPTLNAIAKEFSAYTNVVLLGYSIDEENTRGQVSKIVQKYKLAYPVGIGTREVFHGLHAAGGIPFTMVIDADGNSAFQATRLDADGVANLKNTIYQLLNVPPPVAPTAESTRFEEWLAIPEAVAGLHPDVFKLKWEVPLAKPKEPERFYPYVAVAPLVFESAPACLVSLSEHTAALIDVEQQTIFHTVELPDSMSATNANGGLPDLIYLNTPDGGAIAGIQHCWNVQGRSRSSGDQKLFVAPISDTSQGWGKMAGRRLSAPFAVPVSENEDILVINYNQTILFMDYQGNILLNQAIPDKTILFQLMKTETGGLTAIWADDVTVRGYDFIPPKRATTIPHSIEGGE